MKTKIFFILIAVLVSSCSDDFLDRKPKGALTYNTFFINEEQAIQSVNAIYNKFRSWEFTGLPYLGATDIVSDDADKGSTPNDAFYLGEVDDFAANTSNEVYASMWRGHYQAIFRANLAIQNIPAIAMDDKLKTRLIGEAKLLRAFCYYRLSQWYGALPIVETQLSDEAYFSQERKSPNEVYAFIEKDLNDAIASLPQKSKYPIVDLGRATAGAARGILAKVYMVQQKYDKALEQCKSIVSSGEYALMSNYSDLFSQKGEHGTESIFEISAAALAAAVAGPGASPFNMVQGVRGVPNLGWGFNRPSDDLIKSYEAGDPRRQATVLYVGEVLPDGSAKVEDNPDMFEERYNQKAWVPRHAGLQDNGPGNLRLLRYADIILLAAEASNELGNTQEALTFVNQIRKRARGSNNFVLADLNISDKNILRERIRKERRVELAMEQQRWFDLKRYNAMEETFNKIGKNFMSNKHELFPIPQTEIDLTTGVLVQNKGW